MAQLYRGIVGLKRAVDQALSLRGSRDFSSREEYAEFLRELLSRRNALRRERVTGEVEVLRALPERRLEDHGAERLKVTSNSTINVRRNIYSVSSQLIREAVEVRVFAERLAVWTEAFAWPRWNVCAALADRRSTTGT